MQTKEQLMKDVVRGLIQCGASPKQAYVGMEQLETQVKQWFTSEGSKQKITFKQARLNNGMSLERVSQLTGIHKVELEAYEEDSTQMLVEEAIALCQLYRVSIDNIFWGKTPKGRTGGDEDAISAFLEFARRRIEESESIPSNQSFYAEKQKKIPTLLRELMEQNQSEEFHSKLFDLEDAFNCTAGREQENAYFQGFKDAIKMFA